MKNIFSLLSGMVLLALSCTAQKVSVPKAVTDAFVLKFPEATSVSWGKENAREYEAEFKLNNTSISANFSIDGNWVETETEIAIADLPGPVSAAIEKKYPDAMITGAEKVEQPGKTLFEARLKIKGKKKNVELTPDGNFTE